MTEIPDPKLLAQQRDRIRNQLVSIGDFRPGNLTEYYRKCGKPYCRCTQPEHPGHGPSWMLTRKVDSKTLTRNVPQQALEQTHRQMKEYRRFRDLVKQMIEINDALCHAQVKTDKVVNKGALKKTSMPRSPPR